MYFCMIQIYWFDFYMFFEGLYFDSCSIFWASVSYINSLMGLSGFSLSKPCKFATLTRRRFVRVRHCQNNL